MKNENISSVFLGKIKKLGIEKLEELLLHLPKEYKDYGKISHSIRPFMNVDESAVFRLKIVKQPKINSEKKYISLYLTDGVDYVSVTFFGISESLRMLNKGDIVHIEGKITNDGKFINIKSPTIVDASMLNRIFPIYRGEPGVISKELIAKNIAIVLRDNLDEFVAYVEETYHLTDKDIVDLNIGFDSLSSVFTAIHRPVSLEQSQSALDGVLIINARTALHKALSSSEKPLVEKSFIGYEVDDIKVLVDMLPYTLTPSQKRSIWDISKDLSSNYRMDRLLSGDVGFGKTLTYSIPAVCAHKKKKFCIIITPNTLLSIQIADEIKETFNVEHVRLVLGDNAPKPTREELFENYPIIVGTTAILHWVASLGFTFNPDFLIIDEQQKLGNEQKQSIVADHTNVLEATATAIPRTQALVSYGDKKVSYLTECPVEKNIKTVIVGKEKQKQAFQTLKNIIEKENKQIAVLYPIRKKDYMFYDFDVHPKNRERFIELVESISQDLIVMESGKQLLKLQKAQMTNLTKLLKSEDINVGMTELPDMESAEDNKRNVESSYETWNKLYPGEVVMIHGGLSSSEKIEALEIAKSGKCKVVVTSSVIEIGLTMPDLMGLYVKNADRYGASTLHQFRGRVSRKGGKGIFMLGVDCLENDMSDKSKDRLGLLVKYDKGYEIAVEDMRQRGFGDLDKDGTLQSGNLDGMFKGVKVHPDHVEELIKRLKVEQS